MVLVPDSHPYAPQPDVAEPSADSFDNIDALIDGTAASNALPVQSPKSGAERWKIPENAKATVGPADQIEPKTLATSPEETEPPSPGDFVGSSTSMLRKVFFVSGGVVLGTAIAIGLTVVLAPSGDDPAVSAQVAKPLVDPPLDESPDPVEKVSEEVEYSKEDPDRSESFDNEQLDADEPVSVERTPDDLSSNDQLLNIPNDVPTEPPAEPTPHRPAATEDETGPQPRQLLVPLDADDELTEFARWLRDDDAEPVNPDVAPEVVETIPQPETPPVVAIQQTRPEPQLVDVEARLADTIKAIQFREVELNKILRSITRLTTIPITVEPDALQYWRISPRKKLSVRASESNVSSVLASTLAQLELDFHVDQGQVVVTTVSSKNRRSKRIEHDVSDLCQNQQEAESLLSELRRLVDAQAWPENSGSAKAEVESRQITITHYDLTQFRVLRFLERLRTARGLPTKSKLTIANTKRFQAASALSQFVSLRFPGPASLVDIAEDLEKQVPINFLIDWRALHFAGWAPRDKVDFFRDNQTLQQCLGDLLNPMGLTYVVLDASTVLVTSIQDSFQRNEVEFYQLDQNRLERFAAKLDSLSKRYTSSSIQFSYDQPRRLMIVSAPQQVHRDLATD